MPPGSLMMPSSRLSNAARLYWPLSRGPIDVEDKVQRRLDAQDDQQNRDDIADHAQQGGDLEVHQGQADRQHEAQHASAQEETAARPQRLPPRLGRHARRISRHQETDEGDRRRDDGTDQRLLGLDIARPTGALEQVEADADLIGGDQRGKDRDEPLLQDLQPPLGGREQRRGLAFLEDGGGTFLPGQLVHVELFLLGETALVELHGQDQPDQGRRQDLPAHGGDGEESAPATQEERDAEEDQAQNQGGPGDLFGTFGRYCHWRLSSRL